MKKERNLKKSRWSQINLGVNEAHAKRTQFPEAQLKRLEQKYKEHKTNCSIR